MPGKVLDIGCGENKLKGAIGIDITELDGVDIVHDLNDLPWPFADQTFDRIYMNDIIEHLRDPIRIIEEVHRLLKPNGRLIGRIVHWNHRYAVADPTHIRFFSRQSLLFFMGKKRAYYSKARFDLERFEYQYDQKITRWIKSQRILNFLGFYLNNIIQGMQFVLVKKE